MKYYTKDQLKFAPEKPINASCVVSLQGASKKFYPARNGGELFGQ